MNKVLLVVSSKICGSQFMVFHTFNRRCLVLKQKLSAKLPQNQLVNNIRMWKKH